MSPQLNGARWRERGGALWHDSRNETQYSARRKGHEYLARWSQSFGAGPALIIYLGLSSAGKTARPMGLGIPMPKCLGFIAGSGILLLLLLVYVHCTVH